MGKNKFLMKVCFQCWFIIFLISIQSKTVLSLASGIIYNAYGQQNCLDLHNSIGIYQNWCQHSVAWKSYIQYNLCEVYRLLSWFFSLSLMLCCKRISWIIFKNIFRKVIFSAFQLLCYCIMDCAVLPCHLEFNYQ